MSSVIEAVRDVPRSVEALVEVKYEPAPVMDAAMAAWHATGMECSTHTISASGTSIAGVVEVESIKQVEVFASTLNSVEWDTLIESYRAREWSCRAVVPIGLIGKAHELLRGSGMELQAWWENDHRVLFSATEIA